MARISRDMREALEFSCPPFKPSCTWCLSQPSLLFSTLASRNIGNIGVPLSRKHSSPPVMWRKVVPLSGRSSLQHLEHEHNGVVSESSTHCSYSPQFTESSMTAGLGGHGSWSFRSKEITHAFSLLSLLHCVLNRFEEQSKKNPRNSKIFSATD